MPPTDHPYPPKGGDPRALRGAVVGAGPAGLYATGSLTDQHDMPVSVHLIERLPARFGLSRDGVASDRLKIKPTGAAMHPVLEHPRVRSFANVAVGSSMYVDELAITGVGNVALDGARLLLKEPADLEHTDIPQDVLDVLRDSAVTDVHIVARRAPHLAKFTFKKLREFGEPPNVDVILTPDQLVDAGNPGLSANDKRNIAVMAGWSQRRAAGRAAGCTRVSGRCPAPCSAMRTSTDCAWSARTTTVRAPASWCCDRSVPARWLFRACLSTPGSNTIPTVDRRVIRDGRGEPGRLRGRLDQAGPGRRPRHKRKDASQTVTELLADAPALLRARDREPPGIDPLLAQRGIRHVDLQRRLAIVDADTEAGAPHQRGRVTLAEWNQLLKVAAPWETQETA